MNYIDKYNSWCNSNEIDEADKKELISIANDDKEIAACSVMKGDNENLVLSQIYCQSNCQDNKQQNIGEIL